MSGLFDDLSSLVSAMRRDEYSPRHGIPVFPSSARLASPRFCLPLTGRMSDDRRRRMARCLCMHGEIEVSGCSGYMNSYLNGMRNLLPHGIPPLEPANLGPRVPIF